jgi:hypothetical protein
MENLLAWCICRFQQALAVISNADKVRSAARNHRDRIGFRSAWRMYLMAEVAIVDHTALPIEWRAKCWV